ncbi:hypothetical protein B9Z55_013617 [Caenorhabditis nigoni]|uniref:Uncharacterized protein n=1 Tax=Caenorhabditis nigoni TaxID=1611254 RepID=A0A2G5U2G6_9PELO|nr:hypothetical protein B9Z55_013617 [Caenorhabditis nigoni]
MKYALLGALILLCSNAILATEDSEKKPDDSEKEKERKFCLDSQNTLRRNYAELKQISNMRKLEYDKSMEDLKSEMEKCPDDFETTKYSDGVWATKETSDTQTAESALASKYACVIDKKCGRIGLINKQPNWNDGKKGKPGSDCSGEVDDGLCVGSSPAFSLFIVFSFIPILYL